MPPKEPVLGLLCRKRGRSRRKAVGQVKRSLCGFFLGLFFASIYGATALFIQNHELWFSVITTIFLAVFAGFGAGLSERVRINVILMLPVLCSKRGKTVLLFFICTLVIQGPVTNTMENIERAAESVICGTELAMNQVQQLMQRATNPLLPALGKIKQMARNAYSMAGRVQNFFSALTESVKHVARILQNVMHFLASVGDVCNDNLGQPYQKCIQLFNEAQDNCLELLSSFSFLCQILDGFQPLCGLARVGQLFCVIPSYVANHLKTALAYPTTAVFNQMKKQFEFNISISHNFDLDLNSSQSMQDAAQEIMEEVSEVLSPLQELKIILAYAGFFLLLFMYLQAVLYKHKYLHDDEFDNFYITDQLIELDRKHFRQGKATVLPLSVKETLTYIRPCSLYLTGTERRAMTGQMLSLLRYMVMTLVLIAVDLMVFWFFELVHSQAQGEIIAQAPVIVAVLVNGSGYASDIFRDIAASFDILQKGQITVLSKKCLMKPLEPDYMRYLLIGLLYGFILFIVSAGGYITRSKRFLCARYHPEREKERIQYLHKHILSERNLPGGAILARLLDVGKEPCMACGKLLETGDCDEDEVHICPTPRCIGRYCSLCFRLMGNVCAICMGSHMFQEDQELDSSDEDLTSLCEATVTSARSQKKSVSLLNQDPSEWSTGQPSHHHIDYTDLELAINTLVQNFHSASPSNADTLTAQEFQSMISKELPTMMKTAGDQEGLGKLLKEIEVEDGKGVMFKDFWRLVESLASTQFGLLSKEKQVKCVKCSLM
ncbi:hypothetical protein DNTS_029904 [Danionella cerebrum]|uniref:S100/CaBP-9k-type calcium binding subdomain domain-containing protein n=1 Tax=Danionella cerebrum TaxID=2873325 RepID=A0A553RLQ8_9TELE|nr:hypothetical protein DNTS_029904 [Danionella translucida]